MVDGHPVTFVALPLIFDQLHQAASSRHRPRRVSCWKLWASITPSQPERKKPTRKRFCVNSRRTAPRRSRSSEPDCHLPHHGSPARRRSGACRDGQRPGDGFFRPTRRSRSSRRADPGGRLRGCRGNTCIMMMFIWAAERYKLEPAVL